MCGCNELEALRIERVSESEMEARASLASSCQKRWGCPVAGHTPPAMLPPDLLEEGRYFAEMLGLVPIKRRGEPLAALPPSLSTCPFVSNYRLPAWCREILRAWRLMRSSKGGLAAAQILGREPHVWDVRAFDAIDQMSGDVARSDEAIREAQRPKAPPR